MKAYTMADLRSKASKGMTNEVESDWLKLIDPHGLMNQLHRSEETYREYIKLYVDHDISQANNLVSLPESTVIVLFSKLILFFIFSFTFLFSQITMCCPRHCNIMSHLSASAVVHGCVCLLTPVYAYSTMLSSWDYLIVRIVCVFTYTALITNALFGGLRLPYFASSKMRSCFFLSIRCTDQTLFIFQSCNANGFRACPQLRHSIRYVMPNSVSHKTNFFKQRRWAWFWKLWKAVDDHST